MLYRHTPGAVSTHHGHFMGTFEQGDAAVDFSAIEYVNRTILGQLEFL